MKLDIKSKNNIDVKVGMVVKIKSNEFSEWSGWLKGVVVAVYQDTLMVCNGKVEGYYEVPTNECIVLIPSCGYGKFLF